MLAALFALAAMPRIPNRPLASGHIAVTAWPYLPGTRIPLRIDGLAPPFQAVVLGPGRLNGLGEYEIPIGAPAGKSFVVAGNGAGLASVTLRVGDPPPRDRALLVVASYDDGLVLHDAANFSVIGVLGIAGAPADVAVDLRGRIATADTQDSTLTLATLFPWNVTSVGGVELGDEIAVDEGTRAIFVTDRDVGGSGALTRLSSDGGVTRVATGATAEGLAIDERRQIVYVANANDGTIAAIDARSMRLLDRIRAVTRVFSLALSPDGMRLYAVSNQSANSPFAASGSVVALARRGTGWHRVARSGDLTFPLGVALDPSSETLFVTDEERSQIEVLDAHSLRARRAPLETCRTPWKPLYDERSDRLYVPCAESDAIDVFNARTLERVAHAPFSSGSYPLAVAAWHPPREDSRATRSFARRT
jgi:DNA-binding beta-propeller fold protein YncE